MMTPEISDISLGQVLRGDTAMYSVVRFLGEGSFGKVLECINMDTNERVAVKMLKDPAAIREAEKEVAMLKIMGDLDTERCNVVTFKECFSHKGLPCLVFEMLDISLWDHLVDHKRRLSTHEIRPIARQLLVAFDALKDLNMIHSDLKPDNIMFTNMKMEPYKVKLIDFGLALPISEVQQGRMKQPNGYRAPEVTLGCKYDDRIDMFGLGCTLAFLLLRKHLFPDSLYQSAKMLMELQGIPPDHMLRDGWYTKYFFKQEGDPLRPTWRLLTPDEFSQVTHQNPGEPSGLQDYLKTWDDLINLFIIDDPEQLEDLWVFVDFLKGLLMVDPRIRLTPKQALEHSFITMAHLSEHSEYSKVSKALMQRVIATEAGVHHKDNDQQRTSRKISLPSATGLSKETVSTASSEDTGSILEPFALDLGICKTESSPSSEESSLVQVFSQPLDFYSVHVSQQFDEGIVISYTKSENPTSSEEFPLVQLLSQPEDVYPIHINQNFEQEHTLLQRQASDIAEKTINDSGHVSSNTADHSLVISQPEDIFVVHSCDPLYISQNDDENPKHMEVSEIAVGQVLCGRTATYSVLTFLGEGSFGKVLECLNMETNEKVAIKMLKDPAAIREAQKEVSMLEFIGELDTDSCNLVTFIECFSYMGLTFLVFEMLDTSLWDCYKKGKIWDPCEIRPIAQQLLEAFKVLKYLNVIHADLKPDNIMLTNINLEPYRVKLIDFGLARKTCEIQQGQMRQPNGYRAPEVILGCNYGNPIDMFGTGCSLAFLLLEHHLFPSSTYQSMKMMVDLLGMPPDDMLQNGLYTKYYFKQEYNDLLRPRWRLLTPEEYRHMTGQDPGKPTALQRELKTLDDVVNLFTTEDEEERIDLIVFVDFLKGLLTFDPRYRLTPEQALQHPFITMGHLTGAGEYSAWCEEVMHLANLLHSEVHQGEEPPASQDDGSNRVPAATTPSERTVSRAMDSFPQTYTVYKTCSREASDAHVSSLLQVFSQDFPVHFNQHMEEHMSEGIEFSDSIDQSRMISQPEEVIVVPSSDPQDITQNEDEKTTHLEVSDIAVGQVLCGRTATYSVLTFLGEGSFGKVLECLNMETNEKVAIKMLKDPAAIREAQKEVSMLEFIGELDTDSCNLVTFIECFSYMGLTFLVFEMLDTSLWDCYKKGKIWDPCEIRPIAQQLLEAFKVLKYLNVIHADLKPDNIMLTNINLEPYRVKLIDFGLARKTCEIQQGQMRQPNGYRAPEVILGCNYGNPIDMFGTGCSLAFLLLEHHLFPSSTYQSMKMMVDLLGMPPDDMLQNGLYTKYYFKQEHDDLLRPSWRLLTPEEYRHMTGQDPGKPTALQRELKTLDDVVNLFTTEDEEERIDLIVFVDFLKGLLTFDPRYRLTPEQALQHPFITMGHLTGAGEYSVWCKEVMHLANLLHSEAHQEEEPPASQDDGSNRVLLPAATASPEGTVFRAMDSFPQTYTVYKACSHEPYKAHVSPLLQVFSQDYPDHFNSHMVERMSEGTEFSDSPDQSRMISQPEEVIVVPSSEPQDIKQNEDEKTTHLEVSAITEGHICHGITATSSVLRFIEGESCFGQVLECLSLDTKEKVAVKMLKDPAAISEAEDKVARLEFISELNAEGCNEVAFKECFHHMGLTCPVFNMLDISLWVFILKHRPTLSLSELRPIAQQLLVAFNALKHLHVVHTDLKPDTIMLTNMMLEPYKVKHIDCGLALLTSEVQQGQMRQPNGYRAPEVTLGFTPINCRLAFLLLRYCLLLNSSYQSLKMIEDLLAKSPDDILRDGWFSKKYFKQEGDDKRPAWCLTPDDYSRDAHPSPGEPSALQNYRKTFHIVSLFRLDNEEMLQDPGVFQDFLKGLLALNQILRPSPEETVQRPFVTMDHHIEDSFYLLKCIAVMQCVNRDDSEIQPQLPASPEDDQHRASRRISTLSASALPKETQTSALLEETVTAAMHEETAPAVHLITVDYGLRRTVHHNSKGQIHRGAYVDSSSTDEAQRGLSQRVAKTGCGEDSPAPCSTVFYMWLLSWLQSDIVAQTFTVLVWDPGGTKAGELWLEVHV